MNKHHRLNSLEQLRLLRERQIDSLGAGMQVRYAEQRRFVVNIERLDGLCQTSGASGAVTTAATLNGSRSANCGNYKQAVMNMADAHRVDLALHEADTAVARATLATAARRQKALEKVIDRTRARIDHAERTRERKVQDELSVQVWDRGRK
jgi:flagellar export protein FliJ